ncbi:hypothetical protein JCGZ_09380 [Jatropha curcas]|uniref:DWNN domain-containing protein n=1 Tax=Jatropha curcas TaxID=180498 RepID=A0A067KG95_JATCU|nr:hypothetical protein JCGZ_09380 [Jatropha curcas]
MAIYFKFISAKDYDAIAVDSPAISVSALKRKIFEFKYKSKNGLCRGTDFDLAIINAQTNEQYLDDMLIPKNTGVLIRRVPGTGRGSKKPIDTATIAVTERQIPRSRSKTIGSTGSSSSATGASVSSKPASTNTDSVGEGFDNGATTGSVSVKSSVASVGSGPGSFRGEVGGGRVNGRGSGVGYGGLEKKTPPEGYVCHRCSMAGHFIQHCPTNGNPGYDFKRMRPPTVLKANDAAFEKEIFGCFPAKKSSLWLASDLPPELLCPLCKQGMKNAVMTSKCCFSSFCDKCIRDYLIGCKLKCVCGATDVLTDHLIPNMTLRDTINRILESGSGSSSSGTNVQSNSVKVTKSESQTSSSSEKEQKQSPSLAKIEDKSNNGKAVDVPHPLAKKATTARAADVSEVTTGSIRKEEPGNKGEMRQKVVSKRKRNFEDVDAESYMMPISSYAYSPYWGGMQVGMGYGFNPFYMSFSGMNQYSFYMQ